MYKQPSHPHISWFEGPKAKGGSLCGIGNTLQDKWPQVQGSRSKNPKESSSVVKIKGSWAAPIVVVGEDLEDHHNLVGQVLLRDQLPVAELHAIQVHLNALCRHLAPEGDG